MVECYSCVADDVSVEVQVDLDFAPDPDTIWMLWAFVPLQNIPDEKRIISSVVEQIKMALEFKNAIHFAGVKIIDGWIEIYFYATHSKGAQSVFEQILSKQGYLRVEFGTSRDPNHSFYHKQLYPNLYEQQQIKDKKIIKELQECGDDITLKHCVEHYLFFQTQSIADRVSKKLEDLGELERGLERESECRYGLVLNSVHTLQNDDLSRVTSRLIDISKNEHGEYLGWSTTHVK